MHTLRVILATVAAVLCALALSVGAALAEEQHAPGKPGANSKSEPNALFCPLRDVVH